jgi:hypothetical protein
MAGSPESDLPARQRSLETREHAAYHAAMCLSEAMQEVVRRCSQDFPTETPIEVIERMQAVRDFAKGALTMTNEAIDIAGRR